MQQIFRRTPLAKWDFNKVAKQLAFFFFFCLICLDLQLKIKNGLLIIKAMVQLDFRNFARYCWNLNFHSIFKSIENLNFSKIKKTLGKRLLSQETQQSLFNWEEHQQTLQNKLRNRLALKQPPEVFYNKSRSQKFHKIHRKTPVPESLFFNKVAGLRPATLLKKKLWHSCFPVNFAEFLRAPFLQNTSGRLLLRFTMLQNSFKSISVDAIV